MGEGLFYWELTVVLSNECQELSPASFTHVQSEAHSLLETVPSGLWSGSQMDQKKLALEEVNIGADE
jgi:hypothetical protein